MWYRAPVNRESAWGDRPCRSGRRRIHYLLNLLSCNRGRASKADLSQVSIEVDAFLPQIETDDDSFRLVAVVASPLVKMFEEVKIIASNARGAYEALLRLSKFLLLIAEGKTGTLAFGDDLLHG